MLRVVAATLAMCWMAVSAQSQTITVIAPNGGEVWAQQSTKMIRWTSADLPAGQLVDIRLVKNNTVVGDVAVGVPASAGIYAWTVGNYVGGQASAGTGYQIRVRIEGVVNDSSDASFTIVPAAKPQSISVVSPNGGEAWMSNTTQLITWTSSGMPVNQVVGIQLMKNNAFVGDVAVGVPASSGSYAWNVGQYIGGTAAAGTGYQIRVHVEGAVSDSSNGGFEIKPLTLGLIPTQFVSPAGGETWLIGSTQTIRWRTNSTGLVRLVLSYQAAVKREIGTVSAEAGAHTWNVGTYAGANGPAVAPAYDHCRLRIESLSGSPMAESGSFKMKPGGQRPDLVVCLRDNQKVWGNHAIKVRIKNMGPAPAPASEVRVAVENGDTRDIAVHALGIAGTAHVDFAAAWAGPLGNRKVFVTADRSHVVDEVYDTNNTFLGKVKVISPPSAMAVIIPPPYRCSDGSLDPTP